MLVLRLGARLDLSLPVRVRRRRRRSACALVQLLARGMTSPLREMAAAATRDGARRPRACACARRRATRSASSRARSTRWPRELADVDRQRRDLVANVSHELRTPIGALQALLENLADGVEPPDPRPCAMALAQTERLGRLVAQLLDLSRMESGALPLAPGRVRRSAPLLEQALRECALGEPARCG